MNKVVLIGRLTRDPVISWSQGQETMCIARYTLAVDRRGRKQDGQQTADFISCVAFGKNGEFAMNYLRQGIKIAVEGHIQTGSYTNRDGQKVYTTDVVVENHEFVESKAASQQGTPVAKPDPAQANGPVDADGFMYIPDGVEDAGLPFN